MGHPISTPFTTTLATFPRTSTQQTIYFTSIDNDNASEQAAKIEEIVVKPKNTAPTLNTEASVSPPQQASIEIFSESAEETTLSAASTTTLATTFFPDISTPPPISITTLAPTTSLYTETINAKEEVKKVTATPLSAFLVPGGQQDFKLSGRPTITKVASPHISASAPLLSNLQAADLIETAAQSREPKVTQNYSAIETSTKADTSWYFANYNKTNLEPFIGGITQTPSCGQGQLQASFGFWFCVPGLILLIN